MKKEVQPFPEAIREKFHANTYVFYSNSEKYQTWGDVAWKRNLPNFDNDYITSNLPSYPPITDLLSQQPLVDRGTGRKTFGLATDVFILQPAAENGDGTVPVRSGRAPTGKPGVRACVPYPDVNHEPAYTLQETMEFALWAVTRIVSNVKGTVLEYK